MPSLADPKETPRNCSACGTPFRAKFWDQHNSRVVWYWCPRCDQPHQP